MQGARLSQEQKEELARGYLREQLKSLAFKKIGTFCAIESLKVLSFTTGTEGYSTFQIILEAELIFYLIEIKRVYTCKIKQIKPYELRGEIGGYEVLFLKNEISTHSVNYNASSNSMQFANTTIKVDSFLKFKCTSIKFIEHGPTAIINGSCKNLGLGLVNESLI